MFNKSSFARRIADKLREEDKAGPDLTRQPLPEEMQALLRRMP
jgi:hypothetical protein